VLEAPLADAAVLDRLVAAPDREREPEEP